MTSKLRTIAALPMVGLAILGLTACSGGGRPSVEEIKNAMTEELDASQMDGSQEELFDCMAHGLHDSKDISDEDLNRLVHEDSDSLSDEEEQKFTEIATEIAENCAAKSQ